MTPFETYTLDGCKVEYFYDTDSGPPWEDCDGHGSVRLVPAHRNRSVDYRDGGVRKRPGERILHQDRHTVWLYDWQEACKQARKENWGPDQPDCIAKAVQADFDHLQSYLEEDWYYVGIRVTLQDQTDDVWGVESNCGCDKEIAQELANGLNRRAQKEAAEAFHWACRDLATA